MKIFGLTDTGVVRSINQDAFAHGVISEKISWAIVCDGMGGMNGGDLASRVSVETMTKVISEGISTALDSEALRDLLAEAIYAANDVVYEMSKKDPSLIGMGTTVVAAAVLGSELVIAHVGDSRAYLISSNSISQVTTDHSLVQEMVDCGKITEEEARVHPRRNVITRALGVAVVIEIDSCVRNLADDEAILLCSDGLTNFLGDNDILELFRTAKPEEFPKILVDKANENGGGDNITAVIMYQTQKEED